MAISGDGEGGVRAEWELKIMEILSECQQRNEPMFVLSMEVAKCVGSAGLGLPSPELGELMVTQLCLPDYHSRHKAYLWKFLDHALSSSILSPLQVLALLTSRVLPNRMSQPEAYRLYLELLSRYVLSVDWLSSDACSEKIIKSIDVALQLSQNYGVQVLELGHVLALCFFCIMLALIDSTLCDWGLQITTACDTAGIIKSADTKNMDVDDDRNQFCRRTENCEQLRRTNSLKAFEVVGKLSESRKAMVLLRLVYLNIVIAYWEVFVNTLRQSTGSKHWRCLQAAAIRGFQHESSENRPGKFNALLQRTQFLEACKLSSLNMKSANQVLTNLSLNIQKTMHFEYMSNKCQLVRMLIDIKSCKPAPFYNSDSGRFVSWVPFDITLENAMDGKQFPVTSTIDILTETIYTLKELNDASWQETFLALWLSALRVVQREREPLEGPVPHLESRLCILLCITPLAIARVLKDDEKGDSSLQENIEPGDVMMGDGNEMDQNDHALRKPGLISSLQFLGHYTALLYPPASVVDEANNAVAKAAMFVSSSKVLKGETTGGSYHDGSIKAGAGDMRHLIVEACLARNLIDTSAYFWPQYVPTSVTLSPNPSTLQESPWSRFMEGASFTPTLISALMAVPASSLAELEKLYVTALNGLEEEKSAAATILCGASLRRGWNIQEYAVQYVVKLLSPPVPPNFTGLRDHLVGNISMLSALLSGASSIDTVHILSLHGVVPEVAASLMPLCENFGSIVPTSSSTADSSAYTVFSSAFLFLLRLWKFYRPPLEHCITGRGGAIGGDLSLEYLLLLRNSRIGSNNSATHDETARNDMHVSTSRKPMHLDFYPKLRAWYCQNKSCTVSTLSGLCCGNPVQEVANKILSMIFSKMTRSETLSGDSSLLSGSSCSGPSASNGEYTYQRPLLSAWEVLEAIPFVLEAILTACAHGSLSSRDLTTGLRDLVDYLPASLAAIVSYFAAEITRGTWKAVSMNGTDWPSPAANLQSVESEIREILAAAHVHVPSCLSGVSGATLPLPMAALVSLTITFKLDKSLEYIHAVAGPALENCASGCPWPSMPIISSLWAQKVRRWHDFIVVSASRSVFRQNHEAVSQLLRSCFTSFLGSLNCSASTTTLISQHGVNGLLGNFISAPGQYPRVAPGFLYLRSCRVIHHIQNLNQVIVDLVADSAWELASRWSSADSPQFKAKRMSLAVVVERAKEVGTLGASLLVVGGGQQMVQKLYQETIPTWLLSARWNKKHGDANAVSRLLEGYSMAYLLVLSGALIWGVRVKPPSWSFSRRLHGFQVHMDLIAGVLDGNISVGCDPATWKAYVCCVVGLVVSHTPVWIREVKLGTLRKLATGLIREWHECDLALRLLEKGGVAAMGAAAELVYLL